MAKWANYFLNNVVFKQPASIHTNSLLSGMHDLIMGLDTPLESYGKFFVSTDASDFKTTTLAREYGLPPWAYQSYPSNAETNQSLLWCTKEMQKEPRYNQEFQKVDCSSAVIDMIMDVAK